MSLINFQINDILIWSAYCVISSLTGATKFATTNTKLYVPFVTLSTQDNTKLLQQLKLGSESKIDWNKCQSKMSIEIQNQH